MGLFHKDEIIHRTLISSELNIVQLIQYVNDFVELHLGKLPDLEKLSKELKLSIKNLYTIDK